MPRRDRGLVREVGGVRHHRFGQFGNAQQGPEGVVGLPIAREASHDRLVGVGELSVGQRSDARGSKWRNAARSGRVDDGLGAGHERRAEDRGDRTPPTVKGALQTAGESSGAQR
jgi:hypothetical protein